MAKKWQSKTHVREENNEDDKFAIHPTIEGRIRRVGGA